MKLGRAGLLIGVVLLGALFFFNKKDVTLAKQDNFSVVPIGQTGFSLTSDLQLHNPNLLSSTIQTISEKFYVDGHMVAILDAELNQGIPGRKTTTIPVNVRFSKNDLPQVFSDSTFSGSKLGVTVTGEIAFKNMFTGGKIVVNQTDSILIPAP